MRARASHSRFPATQTRLLIVEDSDAAASALQLLFEQSGCEVAVASDVASAVVNCTAGKPDVMLLDLSLPDGDGLEVLQQLHDHGITPPMTIALTGHDDDEVRQRCIGAGCTTVLVKPAPIAQLLALVRSP